MASCANDWQSLSWGSHIVLELTLSWWSQDDRFKTRLDYGTSLPKTTASSVWESCCTAAQPHLLCTQVVPAGGQGWSYTIILNKSASFADAHTGLHTVCLLVVENQTTGHTSQSPAGSIHLIVMQHYTRQLLSHCTSAVSLVQLFIKKKTGCRAEA